MGRPRGRYGPDKREARNRLLPLAAGRPPLSQPAAAIRAAASHRAGTGKARPVSSADGPENCRSPIVPKSVPESSGQPYGSIASRRRPLRQGGKTQTALSPAKTAVPVVPGRGRTHRKENRTPIIPRSVPESSGQPYALIASRRRPLRPGGKAQTALSSAKTAVPLLPGRVRTHRK